MGGGVFLLFKGTLELHERLEGHLAAPADAGRHAGFWRVIAQIIALDAVFSLDSIITSVGMVDHVSIMMLAVAAAMLVMAVAAAPLLAFVERHPSVIVLCLGFLLMIGLSLLTDGLGYHIPKGYLYAAIIFAVLVEAANQWALRNRRKRISMRDMRESTARVVLGLLGGRSGHGDAQLDAAALAGEDGDALFAPEERDMVARVIRLSGRTARFIMIPRQRGPTARRFTASRPHPRCPGCRCCAVRRMTCWAWCAPANCCCPLRPLPARRRARAGN